MFFGVLCTYAVAYGTILIFNGFVSALQPQFLSSAVDYTEEKSDEFRREDLGYRYNEGVFDQVHRFCLAEDFPLIAQYKSEHLPAVLSVAYRLTAEEMRDLQILLDPLVAFEMWASGLPEPLKDSQRSIMANAVVGFLMKIPPLRQETK